VAILLPGIGIPINAYRRLRWRWWPHRGIVVVIKKDGQAVFMLLTHQGKIIYYCIFTENPSS